MNSSDMPTAGATRRLDPFALAAAAAVFVLAVLVGPPVAPLESRDTGEYVRVSLDFADEWARERPPVYPLLIRFTRLVAGEGWPLAIVWIQVGLLAIVGALLARRLRRQGIGGWVACAVAIAACLAPSLVYFTRSLLPELLLAVLIVFAWEATLRSIERGTRSRGAVLLAAVAGFWSGAAALTKPVWVLGAAPLALGLLIGRAADGKRRWLAALALVAVHGLVILSWQAHLISRYRQFNLSRMGTLGLNFAAMRHGMTELGAGTPLYRYLQEKNLLDAALRLRWDDLKEFNRIKDAIPDELRIDPEFAQKTVKDHLFLFLRLQLPRLPAFFFERPLDSEVVRRGGGPLGALRALHRRAYANYFRVDLGRIALSPCLILLVLGVVLLGLAPPHRIFYWTSAFCLGSFVLLTVIVSFQDPTLTRYRAEIEPILLVVTLLALVVGADRLVRALRGQRPAKAAIPFPAPPR